MKAESFGQRLRRVRTAKGITQIEMANKIGVSQRMMVYYEKTAEYPPAKFIPLMARLLKVPADELLGLKEMKKLDPEKNLRLWNKLKKVEKLNKADQKVITKMIDALEKK